MGSVSLKFSDVEVAVFESTDDAKIAIEIRVLQGRRRVSLHIQTMVTLQTFIDFNQIDIVVWVSCAQVFQMLFEVLGEWDLQALVGSVFFVDQFDPRTNPIILPLPRLISVVDLHCSL